MNLVAIGVHVYLFIIWCLNDDVDNHAMYLRALDQNFLIAMEVLNSVLAVTKPLSVKLQGVSQDIHSAITSINGCIEVLETYREGQKFDELLRNVEKETGTIEMPRIVSKQRHR